MSTPPTLDQVLDQARQLSRADQAQVITVLVQQLAQVPAPSTAGGWAALHHVITEIRALYPDADFSGQLADDRASREGHDVHP